MPVFPTYFNKTQIILLIIGGIVFLLSIIAQSSKKQRFSFILLGLTATCIFSFSALLDPFLNLWDERFHALVAKNILKHPLMPTLYDDPIVNMAYDRWDRYHIWLHKQPLFLWQIAICFKAFGISEFTLRLPNILLGSVLVLITCRSGELLVNKKVGYISGVLTISTIYILELIAGRQELEHNDFTFLVYISLSIWSFIEYQYSKRKYWILLIGLFAGMAILCKWLVGLLVYFGWITSRLILKKFRISENKDILWSFLISIIISAPWQILTFIWYPSEAADAYKLNALHFTSPIDGHGGGFWYHFDVFNDIYGSFASFLIIPAFLAFFKRSNDRGLSISLVSMVVVIYLFFSLAATKMPSFTIVVSMIIFIAFATLIVFCLDYINQHIQKVGLKITIFTLSIMAIVLLRFDVEYLQERHTLWKENNQYSRIQLHNKNVFNTLSLPQNTVLFNVKGRHYIEAMFYTGLPSYNFIPSFEQYLDLKQKGRIVAILNSKNAVIPEYLRNDSSTIYLEDEIKGYD